MSTENHPVIHWVSDHPAFGWAVNVVLWFTDGMSPLAVVVALLTAWWTYEKSRTERAKRRALEDFSETRPGALKRLYRRLITQPSELDES